MQGFGFDLVEAPNKSSYFVVIKPPQRREQTENEKQLQGRILNYDENLKKYRGLICVVLQLLILHGNKCEKDIFNHILFEKLDTSIFGATPQQIIKELKQQKWIEEEKEPNDERTYFKLGPRANIETQSEWQYIAAFELVNGMRPPQNDRALQRIAQEKQVQSRQSNRNRGRVSNYSQGSQRNIRGAGGYVRGGGRRRGGRY